MNHRLVIAATAQLAIGWAAIAATPPQSEPAKVIQSRDGYYEVTVPAGWAVRPVDGTSSDITMANGDEQIGVTFFPSQPGKWNVESLMNAQEKAVRRAAGDFEGTDKRTIHVDAGPAALKVYHLHSVGSRSPLLFSGCVILEKGGVGVVGLGFQPDTVKAVESVLRSVHAKTPGQ